jgi:hypothetical protein
MAEIVCTNREKAFAVVDPAEMADSRNGEVSNPTILVI